MVEITCLSYLVDYLVIYVSFIFVILLFFCLFFFFSSIIRHTRCSCYFFFFFASRRWHTRCSRDWSSDVCSSDLAVAEHSGRGREPASGGLEPLEPQADRLADALRDETLESLRVRSNGRHPLRRKLRDQLREQEIGRASCRERLLSWVSSVSCYT